MAGLLVIAQVIIISAFFFFFDWSGEVGRAKEIGTVSLGDFGVCTYRTFLNAL